MNEFLEQAKKYKELILLIAGIITGVFFVRDYFATKQEVKVLQCQAENGIALVESRMNAEFTTKKIISLKKDIDDIEIKAKSSKKQRELPDTTPLALEIEKLKKELESYYETQRLATSNLKPGICEKAVEKS